MKSTRNLAMTVLATLGISLAFANAQAQSSASQATDATPSASTNTPAAKSNTHPNCNMGPDMQHAKGDGMCPDRQHGKGHGMGQGKQHGKNAHGSEMSQLMTPEERTEMRTKMKAAQTQEERNAIRMGMRAEMEKRAKEKGITLPEHKRGHQHQHGAQAS